MTARALRVAGWCLLVAIGTLGVFVALGLLVGMAVGEAVLATALVDLVVVALGLLLRHRCPGWLALGPKRPPLGRVEALAVVGAMAAVLLAGQAAAYAAYARLGSPAFDGVTEDRAAASVALVALVVVLSLVIAPVAEEVLFRGLAYPLLRRRAGVVVSAVVTSGLFALVHGNLVQAVAVVPMGLVLAVVYERTGSVWVCAGLHAGYNLAAVLLPPETAQALAEPVPLVCLALVAGLGLAAFSARLVRPGSAESAPAREAG